MTDLDAVLEANRNFYRAFESLEIERMEQVWLQAAHIICIHPGWRRLNGWGPIMQSWENIFDSVFQMRFELTDEQVLVRAPMAIVTVQENLTQRGYDGTSRTVVLATNVFERVGNKWMMVLHHGSPVALSQEQEPPIQ